MARRDAVSTAPGKGVSRQTGSPVVTAASARVVEIPSAAIASLTIYSRSRARARASVAPPGKRRSARPLELDVAARASVAIDHLARRMARPSPRSWREVRTGGRHKPWRDGSASLGHPVARENLNTLRCGELSGSSLRCQASFLFSRTDGARSREWAEAAQKSIRQPGVAVIKCKEIDCLDLCRHVSSSRQR